MDGYQLAASLFQSFVSIAWPVAFLAAVWLFRERLNALLPLLRMKYKDLDVSFRLDKAEQEAAALPPPPAEQQEATEPTQEEKSRFEQVAELSPRAAMLEVRTDIEEAVRSLARSANLLTPRVQSTLGLTRLLRSRGVIDSQTSALLDDLRALGNNAAHNPELIITKDEAMRYRSLADQAIAQLRLEEILNNEPISRRTP